MDQSAIIVEQIFEQPCHSVWAAISKLEQMKQWFFEQIPAFEATLGFRTEFAVQSGERTFTHLWTLTEVEVEKRLTYDWRYAEYEGVGTVIFELEKQGNRTLLRLLNLGLETFPQDIPEFREESCRGGWEYFIQQRLKAYLDGE